jgi:hypothetical protein
MNEPNPEIMRIDRATTLLLAVRDGFNREIDRRTRVLKTYRQTLTPGQQAPASFRVTPAVVALASNPLSGL